MQWSIVIDKIGLDIRFRRYKGILYVDHLRNCSVQSQSFEDIMAKRKELTEEQSVQHQQARDDDSSDSDSDEVRPKILHAWPFTEF